MTTYTIAENATFNSREVSFDNKPQTAVIAAMKALRMRWNPRRSVWYGFATTAEIENAIQGAQPETVPAQIKQDGYLGAVAVSGAKSDRPLYGADLSAAIRADIKAAGINGVTVSVKSYAGGQSITATLKISAADCIPVEDYAADYTVSPGTAWVYTSDTDYMHVDAFYALDIDRQIETTIAAARYAYDNETRPGLHSINQYHIGQYNAYDGSVIRKLLQVREIIDNYRYDNSNSQVDYFDTNFYYDLYVKIV